MNMQELKVREAEHAQKLLAKMQKINPKIKLVIANDTMHHHAFGHNGDMWRRHALEFNSKFPPEKRLLYAFRLGRRVVTLFQRGYGWRYVNGERVDKVYYSNKPNPEVIAVKALTERIQVPEEITARKLAKELRWLGIDAHAVEKDRELRQTMEYQTGIGNPVIVRLPKDRYLVAGRTNPHGGRTGVRDKNGNYLGRRCFGAYKLPKYNNQSLAKQTLNFMRENNLLPRR